MIVTFFEGIINSEEGLTTPVIWAQSSFGIRALVNNDIREVQSLELSGLAAGKPLTLVNLEDLNTDDAAYVIDAILKGNYCRKPGVLGKIDAALYLLVNEALGELSRADVE